MLMQAELYCSLEAEADTDGAQLMSGVVWFFRCSGSKAATE